MLEMFFLKEKIEGEFVSDGLEGYQCCQTGEWDFIIIDWMLPSMDGMTFAENYGKRKIHF